MPPGAQVLTSILPLQPAQAAGPDEPMMALERGRYPSGNRYVKGPDLAGCKGSMPGQDLSPGWHMRPAYQLALRPLSTNSSTHPLPAACRATSGAGSSRLLTKSA